MLGFKTLINAARTIAGIELVHRISKGQFMRRLEILKQTLASQQVPEHVASHWLAHTQALAAQVIASGQTACGPQDPPDSDAGDG